MCFKKTKFTLLKTIYFQCKIPTNHVIVFFQTRLFQFGKYPLPILSNSNRRTCLSLFRMGAKPHFIRFPPVTSINQPKKPSEFQFCHTCLKFQGHPQCHSQITELKPRALFKKCFFWSKPCKIQVIITSRRNTGVIKLWSHDHIDNIM